MARLAIPLTQLLRTGVSPAAQVTGVAGDDLEVAPASDALCWVEMENTDTVARTVTLVTFAMFDGLAVEDIAISVPAPTAATLTTALAGANNDLLFTSDLPGEAGNLISIVYVVAGLNTALTVSVTGLAITVNVATDGAGAATSTAAQVKTALEANASAAALLTIANAPANDGTGVVTALASTLLAGGLKGVKIAKLLSLPIFLQADGKVYVDISDSSVLKFRAYRL